MIRIRLSLEGDLIIDRMLAGIEERASDMREAWPALVTAFRVIVGRAFATDGASTGSPWPELAERTQRDRATEGYDPQHPILQRTKTLMRSLVFGDAGGFVETTPQSLAIGTHVPYFPFHQSTKPRKRLPRRAPVLLTADDRHELMRPIRLHLTGRDPNAFQRSRAV